jgi:hypothetical protein
MKISSAEMAKEKLTKSIIRKRQPIYRKKAKENIDRNENMKA